MRRGTQSLLRSIDLLDGNAHPIVWPSHKSSVFVDFLKGSDSYYPKGDTTRLMLYNRSAHTSGESQAHPDKVPGRITLVITPGRAL